MNDKLNITANIPKEITENFYKELKNLYRGSWDDFNALILYMGMVQCLSIWVLSANMISEMDNKKITRTIEILIEDFFDKLDNFQDKNFDDSGIRKILERLKEIK